MDDGKPTGSKPKWWSRPARQHAATDRPTEADTVATADGAPEPTAPALAPAEPVAAEPVSGERVSPEPASERPVAGEPVAAAEPLGTGAPAGHPTETTPPAVGPTRDPAPGAPVADEPPAMAPARPQPLHQPDEYSTPPYGEPGPWAPAPPVQRPMTTPAHGTPHPQPPATSAHGTPHPQAPAPPAYGAPHPQPPALSQPPPQPPAHLQAQPQPSQWLQYDPWSTPGGTPAGGARQPLVHAGSPAPQKRRRGLAVVAALLFAGLTGVLGGGVGAYIERHGGLTTVELPQAGREDSGRAPDSVAGIAASALPGVVTLHVSGGGEQGTGTGFVLDSQGHILTNHHVVDPAGASGDITVTFSGGETAAAELVGKDGGYDLAVVRVKGVSNLKPLPLGNSDNVRVGDPVVAIGAPFDLQNTVTSGIISAKERPITAGGEKGDGSDISYVDALQTDAPINPGNSGGPLLDSKARVIGINSAIRAADSGSALDGGQAGSIGLGFAIPVNQGKRVAEELINTGKASHPVIGVSLDMKYSGDGARVGDKAQDGGASVTPGGPAAQAGIRPGDVITKVDGQRVHSGEELIVKIRAHRPGDRLRLTLERGGKEQTKTLTLGSSAGG
ncbi:trypsin-like peptidase domain-containing protein [Streptomyces ficellus]|uniref:Trypsin-like peptidase domain-containing protein n=1 Tax=Streptomyces ficellus TaxID=1977088 RepID=A0ABT7Z546_9ACTN|nr:trypsin-like peptidase domain-containing protein [Streptomyces ficellus]MDN3294593.1 trypsin-like peptidase domain-containing protein [Streptomyces ficellus]